MQRVLESLTGWCVRITARDARYIGVASRADGMPQTGDKPDVSPDSSSISVIIPSNCSDRVLSSQ
jgi:hypothetical protein